MIERRRALARRVTVTVVIVTLQLVATAFFLADVAADAGQDGRGVHFGVEAAASLALLAGVLFGAAQIRWLVVRARQDEAAVATARGAMAELMRLRFAEWRLTTAEADVALFALKGCDIAEIASLRGTAAGTVRAQLASIYGKAGVNSQVSLIASLVEDLVGPPTGG